MRVLGPVVQVPMLAMSNAGHHHSFRRPIAAQLVSNNDAGFATSCSQQLVKKPHCGETIPLRLN
jgi:hypothetical protein